MATRHLRDEGIPCSLPIELWKEIVNWLPASDRKLLLGIAAAGGVLRYCALEKLAERVPVAEEVAAMIARIRRQPLEPRNRESEQGEGESEDEDENENQDEYEYDNDRWIYVRRL